MGNESTGSITYTVFEVEPATMDVVEFHLATRLFRALENSPSIKHRMMKLSSDLSDKDSDFIPSYSLGHNGFLFGSFVRLKEGMESIVKAEYLDQKTMDVDKAFGEAKAGVGGFLKDAWFFGIQKNILVLSNRSARAFEAYVNWLIEGDGGSHRCRITPKKKVSDTIDAAEIKSISVGDEAWVNAKGNSRAVDAMGTKFQDLKTELLHFLLSDIDKPKDIEWDDIVSATLMLKFRKNRKSKNDALSAALRLVDNQYIKIKDKNGRTFSGGEFVVKVTRQVEKTSNGYYNEKIVQQDMADIIYEVEHGKVVC